MRCEDINLGFMSILMIVKVMDLNKICKEEILNEGRNKVKDRIYGYIIMKGVSE